VESCTAIVEHYDGAFELIRWTDVRQEADISLEPVRAKIGGRAA
jgi:hypothetical protein